MLADQIDNIMAVQRRSSRRRAAVECKKKMRACSHSIADVYRGEIPFIKDAFENKDELDPSVGDDNWDGRYLTKYKIWSCCCNMLWVPMCFDEFLINILSFLVFLADRKNLVPPPLC